MPIGLNLYKNFHYKITFILIVLNMKFIKLKSIALERVKFVEDRLHG